MANYSMSVMGDLRESLGLDSDNISQDHVINSWSKEQLLAKFLEFNGLDGEHAKGLLTKYSVGGEKGALEYIDQEYIIGFDYAILNILKA